jgi:hypothetical protein
MSPYVHRTMRESILMFRLRYSRVSFMGETGHREATGRPWNTSSTIPWARPCFTSKSAAPCSQMKDRLIFAAFRETLPSRSKHYASSERRGNRPVLRDARKR